MKNEKTKEKTVEVVNDLDAPLTVLASAIKKLSDDAGRALSGPLSERTVVLLLYDATGVPKRNIELILRSLPNLARRYLKQ